MVSLPRPPTVSKPTVEDCRDSLARPQARLKTLGELDGPDSTGVALVINCIDADDDADNDADDEDS